MLTKTLWRDAAAVCRVDGPVVVLKRMHELKHCSHSTNRVVDGCCANELGRKVGIKGELHLEWEPTHTHTHIHVLVLSAARCIQSFDLYTFSRLITALLWWIAPTEPVILAGVW